LAVAETATHGHPTANKSAGKAVCFSVWPCGRGYFRPIFIFFGEREKEKNKNKRAREANGHGHGQLTRHYYGRWMGSECR
jgi:hypothetical protein